MGDTERGAVAEPGALAGFDALVGQVSTKQVLRVPITRNGETRVYQLADLRADWYWTCVGLATVTANGRQVYDNHRFQAFRLLACLDGPSEVPGATLEEKGTHVVKTATGPKPAIDFVSELPTEVFDALNAGVEEVNGVGPGAEMALRQKLETIPGLLAIIKYCAEHRKCLKELGDDEVRMAEINAMCTFWEWERRESEAKVRQVIEGAGVATSGLPS